ncbi:MAG: hypothetical protein M1828_005503 [Chrysothrix sp. TS-e1954]|nr:MAG: hypothetical protein M1828_005503 [Chrysothrix sp. TS-e1954]
MGPKKSNQKMSLGTFLGDQSLGSWADEMEDMPMPSGDSRSGYGSERRGFNSMSSFGGGRDFGGDRGGFASREQLPLPNRPPYTAHLGNLSFDVTSGDIEDFFSGCSVTSVRIVEDKLDHKPKGFGYVEFGSLDGLKQALSQSESSFQGRNIRVSVAEPPKDRGETRELNDWTRKGPLPDMPNARRISDRGPPRGFEAASDAGSERGSRRPPPFEQGDGKVRDFGNWERKGPLSPPAGAPPSREGGRPRHAERTFERRESPAWGEGRSQEGSRPPRPAVERQPTAAEMDNQWRARMKPDAPAVSATPTPEPSAPSSPAAAAAPTPATRPRLNLQKRTVSEAPSNEPPNSATSDTGKAGIFGGARPIDSASRDQEVAEKRMALRQKKEEEDKAREERTKAEKAAKAAEKASEKPVAPVQENGKTNATKDTPKEKENGTAAPAPGRNYEILRRMNDQEDGTADTEDGSIAESTNGDIVDDKNVKPKEVVRDMNAPPEQNPDTTAEELEGEGWSTVPKSGNSKRMSRGPAALAS